MNICYHGFLYISNPSRCTSQMWRILAECSIRLYGVLMQHRNCQHIWKANVHIMCVSWPKLYIIQKHSHPTVNTLIILLSVLWHTCMCIWMQHIEKRTCNRRISYVLLQLNCRTMIGSNIKYFHTFSKGMTSNYCTCTYFSMIHILAELALNQVR